MNNCIEYNPPTLVEAMVHSTKTLQQVSLLRKTGDNQYVVKTKNGCTCTAIFNVFTGYYYADDIYGVISCE